jgi:hypothetical protein
MNTFVLYIISHFRLYVPSLEQKKKNVKNTPEQFSILYPEKKKLFIHAANNEEN